MDPLRLVGLRMADAASDKIGEGFWNWLTALGFILPLVGVEELVRGYATASEHVLPWWMCAVLILVGYPLYESKALWLRLRYGNAGAGAKKPLQYLSGESADLGGAIKMMAWYSAQGKWFAAQALATTKQPIPEQQLMPWADHRVWQQLKDGELLARGQKPGQLDYVSIPREHWHSTFPHMVPDKGTLWRVQNGEPINLLSTTTSSSIPVNLRHCGRVKIRRSRRSQSTF
jgi:hypothetical protein